MLKYYPETLSFKQINNMFPKGDLDLPDYDEWQRLIDVGNRKARGKGAPKKAKTPGAENFIFHCMAWVSCI